MSQRISEQAVLFGSRNSLVGIAARRASAPSADRPAVVILNTGIIHRVGHNRMYVTLSRALATLGCSVLRFDFSGIGDSEPRHDGLSPEEGCMADIKEALDWLERDLKASQVILVGLCSGADHAAMYGPTDPRIVGLVLMDPTIPATPRYYLDNFARPMVRLRSWINVLSGRSLTLRMFVRRMLGSDRKLERYRLDRRISREMLELRYQNLVDKGIDTLAIFTGSRMRQSYREQMIEALPNVKFGDRLRLEYLPGSNHTFEQDADRERLIQLILQWIDAGTQKA